MWKRILIIPICLLIIYLGIKLVYLKDVDAAIAAKPVLTTNALDLLTNIVADTAYLNPYLKNVIEFDGVVSDFYHSSDNECFLNLTAMQQTDTSIRIAYPLIINDLKSKADWDACDSAAILMHNLYNTEEMEYKLYIIIEIYNEDSLPTFTINKKCNLYSASLKRNEPRLENFCYDNVRCKGMLDRMAIDGKNIYLIFGSGVILESHRITHKPNYSKRI